MYRPNDDGWSPAMGLLVFLGVVAVLAGLWGGIAAMDPIVPNTYCYVLYGIVPLIVHSLVYSRSVWFGTDREQGDLLDAYYRAPKHITSKFKLPPKELARLNVKQVTELKNKIEKASELDAWENGAVSNANAYLDARIAVNKEMKELL